MKRPLDTGPVVEAVETTAHAPRLLAHMLDSG
jgi:hypothetical protein